MKSLMWALFLALPVFKDEAPALAQGRQPVDLELVLLIDVSASVSRLEYRLQLHGLATAFTDPTVLEAIQASDGVAICIVQWAQEAYQYRSVDWTYLRQEADALRLAQQITAIPRQTPSGQTAIGNALIFALNELDINPFAGKRRVIDVSGDGRSNDGLELEKARETVLRQGITINGLAILNEVANLDDYFRDKLIGGYGAFVLTARDYTDFSRAIRKKLVREIRSTPVAGKNNSYATVKPRTGVKARLQSGSVH